MVGIQPIDRKKARTSFPYKFCCWIVERAGQAVSSCDNIAILSFILFVSAVYQARWSSKISRDFIQTLFYVYLDVDLRFWLRKKTWLLKTVGLVTQIWDTVECELAEIWINKGFLQSQTIVKHISDQLHTTDYSTVSRPGPCPSLLQQTSPEFAQLYLHYL